MAEVQDQEHKQLDDRIPADVEALLKTLPQMDDEALWQAARNPLAREADEELGRLHARRQRKGLTAAEEQRRAELLDQYDRGVLIRSRAIALLHQRGHDITPLLAEP